MIMCARQQHLIPRARKCAADPGYHTADGIRIDLRYDHSDKICLFAAQCLSGTGGLIPCLFNDLPDTLFFSSLT